jgi:hypothetical protein
MSGIDLFILRWAEVCRAFFPIEPVTQRLARVQTGRDQLSVLDAIRRAGGRLDGTRRCFWVPASKLRKFETELRANADLLS